MASASNLSVFMSKAGEKVHQLASGMKAATVSQYRGLTSLHIRRYHGEEIQKYPTKNGINLTLAEFQALLSLQDVILEAFNRLDSRVAPHEDCMTNFPFKDQTSYYNKQENFMSNYSPVYTPLDRQQNYNPNYTPLDRQQSQNQ